MSNKKDKKQQKDWDKLTGELDAYGRKAYAQSPEAQSKLQIVVNEKVSPAKFLPHPSKPGFYMANSLTITAMKTDIFMLGDDIVFTLSPCKKCQVKVERECWSQCPYCGGELSEIIYGIDY